MVQHYKIKFQIATTTNFLLQWSDYSENFPPESHIFLLFHAEFSQN